MQAGRDFIRGYNGTIGFPFDYIPKLLRDFRVVTWWAFGFLFVCVVILLAFGFLFARYEPFEQPNRPPTLPPAQLPNQPLGSGLGLCPGSEVPASVSPVY